MAKLGMGTAITLSVILSIILIYLLGINGMFVLIILGFAATYLSDPDQRSYKIGGIAGIVLAGLIFVYELFVWPPLPITPPAIPDAVMNGLRLNGVFDLIFGLIFSVVIFFLLGALGGLVAQRLFREKKEKPRAHVRRNLAPPPKKPRKTLNKTFKN